MSDALRVTDRDQNINFLMLTFRKMLKAHQTDIYCRSKVKLGVIVAQFTADENGLIFRQAPINGSVQIVFLEDFLCSNLLQRTSSNTGWASRRAQYVQWDATPILLAGHGADIEAYVAQCESYCTHRCLQNHQTWVQFLPPSGPLKFAAFDILGSLRKTRQRNRFIIVLIDWYSKKIRTIPCANETAPIMAAIFQEHWIVLCGILNTTPTDDGLTYVSKYFAALCASVES